LAIDDFWWTEMVKDEKGTNLVKKKKKSCTLQSLDGQCVTTQN